LSPEGGACDADRQEARALTAPPSETTGRPDGRSRKRSTALVTGGASGIGAAIVERLRREGYEVESLDLQTGFDVADPAHWGRIQPVDVACLNAGVVTGSGDVVDLDEETYRRVLAVNVDGVVFGVRALARRMEPGGRIVATASLAGLVAVESDPVYALSKHAVIGFVRSAAPQLAERGITLNAVCPGIVDTPMVAPQRVQLQAAGFPLLRPEEVADAVLVALASDGTGEAWAVQPGREPIKFRFPNVPGPRTPGAEGMRPPL
jgi:NAD(P)-dependent dehydrogenase (short-subunit alcohol dehydrogenase family)